MGINPSTPLLRLYALAFLLCCSLIFLSTAPSKADQTPMSVEVNLATQATISLGEPIMLHYKLSNLDSDEKLAVLRGFYNTSWYTLKLKDQMGNQLRPIPDTRPLEPTGFHAGNIGIYATSDQRDSWQDGYIVVSKSFSIPHSGKYVLTIHVQAPYALVTPTLENPVTMKSMINSAGTVLTQDFNFPLTVTETNPAVLSAKANALKEAISKEQNSTILLPEMDELFSMPEAQAGPVWEQMALQAKPMDVDLIANKVADLHSKKGADILFKMMESPGGNSEFVSRKLSEIYNDGDPALREHIQSAAAQRGIQMPDKVALPVVID